LFDDTEILEKMEISIFFVPRIDFIGYLTYFDDLIGKKLIIFQYFVNNELV
jgi:hypothetical protein